MDGAGARGDTRGRGAGSDAATSSAAVLTVVVPAAITTQPTGVSICETGNATFIVAGSGTGIVYQWQVSTDGGATFSNLNGATTTTYSLTALTAGMNNNRYRVLLSNATCTTPTISNIALLTVYPMPTVVLSAAPYTRLFPGLTTTLTTTLTPASKLSFVTTLMKPKIARDENIAIKKFRTINAVDAERPSIVAGRAMVYAGKAWIE